METSDALYDEARLPDGTPRPSSAAILERIDTLGEGELEQRQRTADATMLNMGITFNVYGQDGQQEQIFPFDLVPRVIDAEEWSTVERGLAQRIRALNLFLDDVYNEQKCLNDGIVPREMIETAKTLRPQCLGQRPPKGVWCHVTGTDLVRDRDGTIYVLEDNLRVPSGVSYVLENREVMKRTFPQLMSGLPIVPVEDYPEQLLETLQYVSPRPVSEASIVVLTPGMFNSAYFEHSYLAQQMGVELVEGSDLVVADDVLYARTTRGRQRVDVIYRRIDDDFLDPEAFREDSMLGVPGLMRAYRAGNVTLCNAPGTGIADDKAIYQYVPDIIRYYLGEDAILPNVPTYLCHDEKQRSHVLENIGNMVVKPTNESGGYGIVIGPHSSKAELEECANRIRSKPREYIAQPMLGLSTVPTLIDGELCPRHVDLRPFILCRGENVFVLPGGLTRVALREGSTIVNSSQGGGSKDTWVVDPNGSGRFTRSGNVIHVPGKG